MFEIQSGIPIPDVEGPTRAPKYPFGDMRVGDCFIIPADKVPKTGVAVLKASAWRWVKTNGSGVEKFAVRGLPNGDAGVWRTA